MGTQASVLAVNKDGSLQLQAGILKITAKQEEVRVVEGDERQSRPRRSSSGRSTSCAPWGPPRRWTCGA